MNISESTGGKSLNGPVYALWDSQKLIKVKGTNILFEKQ